MRSFFFLLALAAGSAFAQQAAPAIDENALRAFVSQQVAAAGTQVTRFDVQVGLVQTAHLAPCRRTEPFLAAGARLWGRGSVGVRCVDGASWTLLVPVTVRAWGPALVAAAPLAIGATVDASQATEQEVELSREAPGVLRELAQVQGRTLTRALAPGQVLRPEMFRAAQVVQAGDPVKLRVASSGFQVTASGQALGAAAEGQTVRVRTDLGKILSGVAHEGRVVDLNL